MDALESLRTKGFPDEDLVTRRYEIMQKFIAGVRSVEVHGALAAKYAEEKYVTEPPSGGRLPLCGHGVRQIEKASMGAANVGQALAKLSAHD